MSELTNALMLSTGVDIPFPQGQLIIHPPKIKEIGYIGEDRFYTGCEFLNFSKDYLSNQDKTRLASISNFEVLLSVMKDTNVAVREARYNTLLVLSLVFPNYQTKLLQDRIGFFDGETEVGALTKENFEDFKLILNDMFCLGNVQSEVKEYNPAGPMAQALVEKFKKARQKKQAQENAGLKEKKAITILSRYASILSVGLQKDKNDLGEYTVYQLFDEVRRFQKKVAYDIWLQSKMAGAKDLKDVQNWMDDSTQ